MDGCLRSREGGHEQSLWTRRHIESGVLTDVPNAAHKSQWVTQKKIVHRLKLRLMRAENDKQAERVVSWVHVVNPSRKLVEREEVSPPSTLFASDDCACCRRQD